MTIHRQKNSHKSINMWWCKVNVPFNILFLVQTLVVKFVMINFFCFCQITISFSFVLYVFHIKIIGIFLKHLIQNQLCNIQNWKYNIIKFFSFNPSVIKRKSNIPDMLSCSCPLTYKCSLGDGGLYPVTGDDVFTHIDGHKELHGTRQAGGHQVCTYAGVLSGYPPQLTDQLKSQPNTQFYIYYSISEVYLFEKKNSFFQYRIFFYIWLIDGLSKKEIDCWLCGERERERQREREREREREYYHLIFSDLAFGKSSENNDRLCSSL